MIFKTNFKIQRTIMSSEDEEILFTLTLLPGVIAAIFLSTIPNIPWIVMVSIIGLSLCLFLFLERKIIKKNTQNNQDIKTLWHTKYAKEQTKGHKQ